MVLKDKVCIITGSSRGIGKAIAIEFAKNGAKLVINSPVEFEENLSTLNEIKNMGAECILVCANVADPEGAKLIAEKTKEVFGCIDVLVNNAGITRDGLMLRMSEEDWDRVLDVNLKGPFNCIKAVSRIMMKTGGSIINMASVVGLMGNVGQANYVASKAGLIGLTKTTAKEFAKKGIRCNAVAPGFIKSDMTDVLSDEIKQNYLSNVPLGRFGEGSDIAKLCTFLASDLSSYITGQVINVDGGLVM